ncbi:MAG: DUF2190 family protein [Desulfobacterales bacterium]|nr:DUF2190 family protein [Desulfobacterales bacterium]
MAVGDIVHFPGQIVTLTAGAGGVSKGDMVYLSAVDTVLKHDAVDKFVIGMACEDIAADAKGPVLICAPVVKATLISATVGKPLVYSATGLTNMTESGTSTECISIVGISWDTVSAADEGRVMLIHSIFRDTI